MVVFKKNDNELTKEDVKTLTRESYKKTWWIIALFPAVFLILGVIGLIFGEDAEDQTIAIWLIVAAPIFLIFLFWVYKNAFRKALQKTNNLASNGATYEFDETGLRATEIGENVKTISEIKYGYYKNVVETETSYLFYINNNGVFTIQKRYLESGTLEEFNQLLTTAYNDNFKVFEKKDK